MKKNCGILRECLKPYRIMVNIGRLWIRSVCQDSIRWWSISPCSVDIRLWAMLSSGGSDLHDTWNLYLRKNNLAERNNVQEPALECWHLPQTWHKEGLLWTFWNCASTLLPSTLPFHRDRFEPNRIKKHLKTWRFYIGSQLDFDYDLLHADYRWHGQWWKDLFWLGGNF